MPIYEYRCNACGRRVSVLTLRVGEAIDARCERCGSQDLSRLLSRFAMPRSEDARIDALTDPSRLGDVDENDPKSMARWMRRMGQEMGDDLGGEDLDEMVDELESGGGTDDDAAGDAGGSDDPGGYDDLD